MDGLRPLGFRETESGNSIQCKLNPNNNLTASIEILDQKKLWISLTFWQSREIIKFGNTSFEKYSNEQKIQRLDNLLKNLKLMQRDELFGEFKNWKDFTICNYESFNFS